MARWCRLTQRVEELRLALVAGEQDFGLVESVLSFGPAGEQVEDRLTCFQSYGVVLPVMFLDVANNVRSTEAALHLTVSISVSVSFRLSFRSRGLMSGVKFA